MFNLRKSEENPTPLDDAISIALERLNDLNPGTKEYTVHLDQIAKLMLFKEKTTPKRISPDTVAIVAGNLAGILMIVSYERVHIVTSKALGFVIKSR